MNILVTLNGKYLQPLTVMLRSLMRADPCETYDLYVAHSTLTEADFRRIRESVDLSRTVVHPVRIDNRIFDGVPTLKRLSKETYYRLLAVDFMPPDTDRVLYIDPDTVILHPLAELYRMDLNGCLIAAAGHTEGFVELLNRARLHLAKGARYINAGILLMDIQAIRREYGLQDIFDYIRKHKKRLYLGDQDVFNGMFTGRIKQIDALIYNLDEKTFAHYADRIDTAWVEKHTAIVHYNGSMKPWNSGYRGNLQTFYAFFNNSLIPGGAL